MMDTSISSPGEALRATSYPSRKLTATPVTSAPPPPEPESALIRLSASRARVRGELMAIAHPPQQPDPGMTGKLVAMVKDVPGANLVIETAQGWWHEHQGTVNSADRASRALLKPAARQYPMSLLIGAAAAGAGLLVLRPWRLLLRPKFLFALASVVATRAVRSRSIESWLQVVLNAIGSSKSRR